jgi:putative phosphoribosyl transferase
MTSAMGEGIVFEDRIDAGRQLAERLRKYSADDPLILALPRGGVIVATEVAKDLGAELDVIVARKVGAPGQPELGIGAVAPGVQVFDDFAIRYLGIGEEELRRITAAESEEMVRRLKLYRGDRPPPRVDGRTVILIDDGLATGVTARAAVRSLRQQNPGKLILAVPVCAHETAASMRPEVDELACVSTPPYFRAVGYWYHDFSQTTDEEVMAALGESRKLRERRQRDMTGNDRATTDVRQIQIAFGSTILNGDLTIPHGAAGIVLFAHGSGSSRHSPRNRYVAGVLQQRGLATLLMDLLSEEEERADARTGHLRFDVGLLGDRLLGATQWLAHKPETERLSVGYFGASTGAAAALIAAAREPDIVVAVVSRGGRPDLAGDWLRRVRAPTLLIVGGNDGPVIELNRKAQALLGTEEKQLEIVPGASHLFEEPGTLEQAARLAADWFDSHLNQRLQVRAA